MQREVTRNWIRLHIQDLSDYYSIGLYSNCMFKCTYNYVYNDNRFIVLATVVCLHFNTDKYS